MNNDVRAGGFSGTERLLIAGWRVHAASNRISRGETTVKLEPRTMALLCYLAERPGEVLSPVSMCPSGQWKR